MRDRVYRVYPSIVYYPKSSVFSIDYCFNNFQIFFGKKYIGIISAEVEFKFSRALVDIINI